MAKPKKLENDAKKPVEVAEGCSSKTEENWLTEVTKASSEAVNEPSILLDSRVWVVIELSPTVVNGKLELSVLVAPRLWLSDDANSPDVSDETGKTSELVALGV